MARTAGGPLSSLLSDQSNEGDSECLPVQPVRQYSREIPGGPASDHWQENTVRSVLRQTLAGEWWAGEWWWGPRVIFASPDQRPRRRVLKQARLV
jgi:hypothetical protein